jgi:plastocyanin
MRSRHLFTALFIGPVALLSLAPASQVCDRHFHGGPVSYQPAPVYYSYSRPAYYGPPVYYQPRVYYTPPMHNPPAHSPDRPTTTISIGASDNSFEPGMVNVQPGTTVRWANKGQHKHTVTSSNGHWDSGDLAPGATYSATFTTPGTYAYHCRHHKGMQGTITVGGGAGSGPGSPRSPGY